MKFFIKYSASKSSWEEDKNIHRPERHTCLKDLTETCEKWLKAHSQAKLFGSALKSMLRSCRGGKVHSMGQGRPQPGLGFCTGSVLLTIRPGTQPF